jgi:hypothetical protein
MLGKRWRSLQARAGIWAAITMMLPGMAYAVSCPNNVPSDQGPVTGTCSGSSKTGCTMANGEWNCPVYQYTNTTYGQKCKYALACGVFGSACEWYTINVNWYKRYGCQTSFFYDWWSNTRVYDYGSDTGCCS